MQDYNSKDYTIYENYHGDIKVIKKESIKPKVSLEKQSIKNHQTNTFNNNSNPFHKKVCLTKKDKTTFKPTNNRNLKTSNCNPTFAIIIFLTILSTIILNQKTYSNINLFFLLLLGIIFVVCVINLIENIYRYSQYELKEDKLQEGKNIIIFSVMLFIIAILFFMF